MAGVAVVTEKGADTGLLAAVAVGAVLEVAADLQVERVPWIDWVCCPANLSQGRRDAVAVGGCCSWCCLATPGGTVENRLGNL